METATAEPVPGHRAAQPESLMTVAELAKYLRMTPSTVYRMVEREQIPTLHLGVRRRSLRFRMADITAWLDSQQVADSVKRD